MAAVGEKPEEKVEKETGPYLGAEIRIIADAKTGGIFVSAPENMITAFGLLEMAKVILVDRQKQALKTQPAIKPATTDDLKRLGGRPS